MTPAAIVDQARADGVELMLTTQGTIRARGQQAAVERWVPVLREHKPDLLAFMRAASDPAADRRRNKVLAMLAADPNLRYALAVKDPNSDPVICTVGIRHVAVGELEIPRAYYKPAALMELLDRHSGEKP